MSVTTLRQIADARWAEFLGILKTRKLLKKVRRVDVEAKFSSDVVSGFDLVVVIMTDKLFSETDFRYVSVKLEDSSGKKHRYLLDVSRKGYVSKNTNSNGSDRLDLTGAKGYDNLHIFRKELYSAMVDAVIGYDRHLAKQKPIVVEKKPVELSVVAKEKATEATG